MRAIFIVLLALAGGVSFAQSDERTFTLNPELPDAAVGNVTTDSPRVATPGKPTVSTVVTPAALPGATTSPAPSIPPISSGAPNPGEPVATSATVPDLGNAPASVLVPGAPSSVAIGEPVKVFGTLKQAADAGVNPLAELKPAGPVVEAPGNFGWAYAFYDQYYRELRAALIGLVVGGAAIVVFRRKA